jgi:GNAT superfamily N-acetyltransferase
MSGLTLRLAGPDDRDAVALLIRDSTNLYYQSKLGAGPIFPPEGMETRDFVDLYRELPGSESLLCVTDEGVVAGSCFFHIRETHMSLGIMNVHPDFFGKGVAKRLLADIAARAKQANLPLRLVSSCLNLDSYSLYTRIGFKPHEFYQDVQLAVPDAGFPNPDSNTRPATPADIVTIGRLELAISGLSRRSDYAHFIDNPDGHWHSSVALRDGCIVGFLASSSSPACNMIGPGFADDEDTAYDLIVTELNQHCGRKPVVLLPGRFSGLVAKIYALGGRNCELHVGQCLGEARTPSGVTLPTFFPETG